MRRLGSSGLRSECRGQRAGTGKNAAASDTPRCGTLAAVRAGASVVSTVNGAPHHRGMLQLPLLFCKAVHAHAKNIISSQMLAVGEGRADHFVCNWGGCDASTPLQPCGALQPSMFTASKSCRHQVCNKAGLCGSPDERCCRLSPPSKHVPTLCRSCRLRARETFTTVCRIAP